MGGNMAKLNNWEETLAYVNRLGVANPTMPIGWRQQVLMANVNLIEGLHDPEQQIYPLDVKYSRSNDTFTVRNLTVKTVHR
jgi:hypothetical protein